MTSDTNCARRTWKARERRQRGYTILELMMTIAVIAVIAGFAVPSFLSTMNANRIVTDNNELISTLAFARSEAIKRGQRVTLCPSADQASCATSGGWEQGWIAFLDPTGFGTVDTGEEVLRVWDGLEGTTVRAAGSFSTWISFVGSGETRATPNNADSFYVCGSDGDTTTARTINVGLLGHPSTQKGAVACP
ncbi:MAG: GspH/FimT family pseudopilin [Pseudomonadota bacterium]